MDITTSTVFIPGATSGIGLALALRLQAAGSTVVIGGRRTELLERLADEHGFDTVPIDIIDPASIAAARDTVLARHPSLDAIIAMAGIMTAEDVRDAGFLDDALRVVETNIVGPLRLVAAFVEHLQTRPHATVMTVSSGLAHLPLAATPTYNGSKAFIHRFSESIRLQLASTSVEVIELVPPAVQTDLMPGQAEQPGFLPLDDFADEVMALLRSNPHAAEILVERVKFLRFAEVEGRFDAAVAAVNA
ncbi:SDR family oxidoreductase [Herbiconiux flava]|uniref:Short-subunit dehydrogenase involved in D-alanine esterification of teichoic acids n=1 Tax=Herbiconiux flava TaxID=881268 RepID=A0A852SIY5_9MICO|nr:SDR family NAD(P)-dependent oxidoreductase [Herbiconiux flava]NYD69213.1 short-subunit dehydrogenase involved in D-alanine esterification of teichoic acids [Herbiconiux flava]GLK15962.1 oxidoreductase [Herbiconiux flava]